MKSLKKLFKKYKIDGYILPKSDEYFNEYVHPSRDRLKFISNFTGSAGFSIILKKKNYLFVDGRYTIQARYQSGKKFKVITIPEKLPKDAPRPLTPRLVCARCCSPRPLTSCTACTHALLT